MSDTPRTDDLARGNHVVPTEFAEGLERELAPLWQSLRDSQDEVLRLTFENRELSQGCDVAQEDQENSRQSLAFALEELEEARNEILGWKNKWTCAIDMAARAELERDQLKEMPSQLLQAECRAERFCQERDDLRAAIKQALPFFKWILETMNPPFDFDKFAEASVAYEQLKKASRHGPLG